MDRRRELDGVTMSRDVHVECLGIGTQQMIVDCGDFDAVLDHLGHHRIDLGVQEHKIAHDHGTAIGGLERDPAAERKRRLDRHAVQRHRQIACAEIHSDGRLPQRLACGQAHRRPFAN